MLLNIIITIVFFIIGTCLLLLSPSIESDDFGKQIIANMISWLCFIITIFGVSMILEKSRYEQGVLDHANGIVQIDTLHTEDYSVIKIPTE